MKLERHVDTRRIASEFRTTRADSRGSVSDGSPSGYQVNNSDYKSNYEQQMNQSTTHMKAPSKEPENQQDRKYRPEHKRSPWPRTATRKVRGDFHIRSCSLRREKSQCWSEALIIC